jgi:hypothetical protein
VVVSSRMMSRSYTCRSLWVKLRVASGGNMTPRRGGNMTSRDTEIHILTDLPATIARAQTIAELYRKRWTIETCQADSTSSDRWCEGFDTGYDRRRHAA